MTFADFPFLRYLFFFALGILLSRAIPEAHPQLFLWILAILWISYAVLLSRSSFWSPLPISFLAYLLLMGLGAFVSLQASQQTLKGEMPWGEGTGYLAEVQRYDLPKANSSENLLSVIGIKEGQSWRPQRALVLVYHQLNTPLVPGQVIWVPKNPESLAPSSFPNEFDYKGYLASKGIHFRQFLGKNLLVLPVPQAYQLKFTLEHLRHYFAQVIDRYVIRPESKQIALAKFGFRADDFSQEWTVLPMANGTTLLDPSLDLCSGKFDSEKDRVERRQVMATKVGSTFTFLSTEVVKYSSAAAASAAQKELVKVLAKCQADKGYKDSTDTLVPYEFKKLPTIPAGVVSEGNRVFVHAVIDTGVRARTLLGFYQFNGDMFTGLYVLNADGFSDAQVAKWMKVAATMGQRLQGKAS